MSKKKRTVRNRAGAYAAVSHTRAAHWTFSDIFSHPDDGNRRQPPPPEVAPSTRSMWPRGTVVISEAAQVAMLAASDSDDPDLAENRDELHSRKVAQRSIGERRRFVGLSWPWRGHLASPQHTERVKSAPLASRCIRPHTVACQIRFVTDTRLT